jgi:hypothetical protein
LLDDVPLDELDNRLADSEAHLPPWNAKCGMQNAKRLGVARFAFCILHLRRKRLT